MKRIMHWFIIIIAAFAINGTFDLVMNEWFLGNICPKILSIPVCYLVLVCFLIALISHLIQNSKAIWVYFFFVGIVTLIATTGTIGELSGFTKCPRTAGGTPMCFISLSICISLLFSKVAILKYDKKQ